MSPSQIELLSADEQRRTLNRLASQIVESARQVDRLVLIGIHTRGVYLAEGLAQAIAQLEGQPIAWGSLDITFYRDDLDRIGARQPERSRIPQDLSGCTVVLVDDVIFTGRTIRAAMDALNDYGRPAIVRLAVLIDRGNRELPIQPDFVGKVVPTRRSERVEVYFQSVDGHEGVALIRPD
ncbi:bifunctional pyr operon transcriptional regulator/uracil phosphoribosyltransferase PyrR [Synechococcus elongatus]|uniref:Bifunctional protein PyrR n=2 Tax=Synechococcus elongatus TaxID=32046 RepID=Q31NM0_SYNE7|nr:bifunctional pyr operon transcriptional regulator/uracil phosphoribosyltransferase PyrR [Synechococcus elongatus]ABB57349.1 Uracil phosphoribosyltransferase [Synechococcus elongatus PCC 7942 = FACHB-805]AJD58141.1 uracil phosphoribosyltransferase [Synechococcus elongatus UTEX 2973]MBD2587756.1 bifunctional pyr operon transcriptional regulator/uracil phosphoribosyltransferase PyrR [Synechococcus elongatus FACHB-242]MBD2688465.1 bifunctional pyr operon transcriptional regulator/uracil phosphor